MIKKVNENKQVPTKRAQFNCPSCGTRVEMTEGKEVCPSCNSKLEAIVNEGHLQILVSNPVNESATAYGTGEEIPDGYTQVFPVMTSYKLFDKDAKYTHKPYKEAEAYAKQAGFKPDAVTSVGGYEEIAFVFGTRKEADLAAAIITKDFIDDIEEVDPKWLQARGDVAEKCYGRNQEVWIMKDGDPTEIDMLSQLKNECSIWD